MCKEFFLNHYLFKKWIKNQIMSNIHSLFFTLKDQKSEELCHKKE
jgi:hypothetical protein